MHAPVKVATSVTVFGLNLFIYVNASANTNRPSASVFKISTVCPERVLTTSPGLVALLPGIFSALATTATTFRGIFNSAIT